MQRYALGFGWLWPARLTCAGAFAALVILEWNRWPNVSPVLGPLGMLWYGGLDVQAIMFCAISLAILFAFLLKPHPMTAMISFLGAMNWLFWGVMALGIGC
jgi:hypothetical protein